MRAPLVQPREGRVLCPNVAPIRSPPVMGEPVLQRWKELTHEMLKHVTREDARRAHERQVDRKCPHPPESVVNGANQYGSWERCLLCQTKLSYTPHRVKPPPKKKGAKLEVAYQTQTVPKMKVRDQPAEKAASHSGSSSDSKEMIEALGRVMLQSTTALQATMAESNQQVMIGLAESNRQVLTGIATMVDSVHALRGEVAAAVRAQPPGQDQADGTYHVVLRSGEPVEMPQVFYEGRATMGKPVHGPGGQAQIPCCWKLPNLDYLLHNEDLLDESHVTITTVFDGLRLDAEDPHWKEVVALQTFSPRKGWHCSSHRCSSSFWKQFANDRPDLVIMAPRFAGQIYREVDTENKGPRQIRREETLIGGEASDLNFCVHVALDQHRAGRKFLLECPQAYGQELREQ
ncbi:VIII-A, partial [Symbiodinium sp. CCMP2456]